MGTFSTLDPNFDEKKYLEGMSDGSNGEINKNLGSMCPSASYHVGYCMGYKEYLCDRAGIWGERRKHVDLVIEYTSQSHPYSSLLIFRLERKEPVLPNLNKFKKKEPVLPTLDKFSHY